MSFKSTGRSAPGSDYKKKKERKKLHDKPNTKLSFFLHLLCQSLMSLVGRRPQRLRLINIHSCVLQPSPERCWSSSAVRPPAAGSSRRPAPVTVMRRADGKVVTAGIHLSLCHTAGGWTKTAAPSFKAVIAFNWLQY